MQRRADTLRLIAVRLGLPELHTVVTAPGVSEAYRLTVHHHDGEYADQVATFRHHQDGQVWLEVVYKRLHHYPAFEYTLETDRYRDFDRALRRLGFDRLDDQPDVPYLGENLWLLERAAGSYTHDVVLAPRLAEGVYAWVIDVVNEQLKEALRLIQPE